MIEPSKIISYVIYVCPNCDHESDMIRLGEAQVMTGYYCPECEVVTKTRSINGVSPVYTVVPKQRVRFKPTYLTAKQIKEAVDIVSQYHDDANKLVLRTMLANDSETMEDLVQQSLAAIKE